MASSKRNGTKKYKAKPMPTSGMGFAWREDEAVDASGTSARGRDALRRRAEKSLQPYGCRL
ncbi:hypothetical protein K400107F7_02060 [Agathobaculum massiliense]